MIINAIVIVIFIPKRENTKPKIPKRNTVVYGRARLKTLSLKNFESEIFLPRSSYFKTIQVSQFYIVLRQRAVIFFS